MERTLTGEFKILERAAPGAAREIRETSRLTHLKRTACDTLEAHLWPLVLVVDDDREFRQLLHAHLQASQRCRTMMVPSAEQALEALQREPVRMLVSDYQMPAMDGLELLATVQQEWPEVVRVLMSGGCDTPQNGHVSAWFVRKHRNVQVMVETVLGLLPTD